MKDDRIYLLHIRDAIRHIVEYKQPEKKASLQIERPKTPWFATWK